MKLYDCTIAPSPRRVRIFLAEKGIALPMVQIDLGKQKQLADAFRAVNPDLTVPVLELDDGTRIADILAICRYFEEVQPAPPLLGVDAVDKAVTEAAQNWCDRDGFYAVMDAFRNWTRGFKDRALTGPINYPQIPELAERGRQRVARFFARLDAKLAQSEYVAGPRFTIADITALVTVDFARWPKLKPEDSQTHLLRWYDRVSARPSAKA